MLVSFRDFQEAKSDIIKKYSDAEARELKIHGEFPSHSLVFDRTWLGLECHRASRKVSEEEGGDLDEVGEEESGEDDVTDDAIDFEIDEESGEDDAGFTEYALQLVLPDGRLVIRGDQKPRAALSSSLMAVCPCGEPAVGEFCGSRFKQRAQEEMLQAFSMPEHKHRDRKSRLYGFPELPEEAAALANFEFFHGRPARIREVAASCAGVQGWAAARLDRSLQSQLMSESVDA